MDLETQARVTEDFVRGLLEHMGLEARVVSSINEDRALVEAQGLNLGLAIGQRGDTVRAITQLARTMVQRMSDGDAEGSLVVAVGGYRERRRSFLTEFTKGEAEPDPTRPRPQGAGGLFALRVTRRGHLEAWRLGGLEVQRLRGTEAREGQRG